MMLLLSGELSVPVAPRAASPFFELLLLSLLWPYEVEEEEVEIEVKPKSVKPKTVKKPTAKAELRSSEPRRSKIVPVASVAIDTRTVSHPTKTTYERKPGSRFPLTPKVARLRTIVGTLYFLPASELTPTRRKDKTVPINAAAVACQKFKPKPNRNAPYEIESIETFAPHQGQKRSLALP